MTVRLSIAALGVAILGTSGTGAQEASLDQILSRARAYVTDFVVRFSNVVAEEQYNQKTSSPSRQRQLMSDFLLVKLTGSNDWVAFRDVFEVDGKPVRERQERLTKLFLEQPSARAIDRVREIAAEGARYNLVNIGTISNPLLAIAFLQPRYQARFRFSFGRLEREAGPNVRVINYQEWARPAILREQAANRDLLARGRFWIETDTGRVVKTELLVGAYMPARDFYPSQITTSFRFDEQLQINLPVELREWHQDGAGALTGIATYGRFRRFDVLTEEKFDPER